MTRAPFSTNQYSTWPWAEASRRRRSSGSLSALQVQSRLEVGKHREVPSVQRQQPYIERLCGRSDDVVDRIDPRGDFRYQRARSPARSAISTVTACRRGLRQGLGRGPWRLCTRRASSVLTAVTLPVGSSPERADSLSASQREDLPSGGRSGSTCRADASRAQPMSASGPGGRSAGARVHGPSLAGTPAPAGLLVASAESRRCPWSPDTPGDGITYQPRLRRPHAARLALGSSASSSLR